MTLSGITESLLFKACSVLVAVNVCYATSAVGVNAVFTSLGEKIRDISRLPKGQYTTEPTAPYLGKHPGRSPETRGGMWPKGTSLVNSGGGHQSIALSKLLLSHTVAVAAAPGGSLPWEGSSGGAGGDLNTGNGNFLTKLHLLDWKSRGLNIDFTLYHNSETNYVGELGAGWTWTYDTAGRTTAVASPTGTTRLTYDYEDRVSGITYPGSSTNSFSYNGLDTRVGKVDSTGTSTYKRDGADVTDPVLSDGSIAYTPGVSQRKSGVSTFDHRDYLGSFTRQTNASQATTATRIFDAFGNLESTTGTPQSSFGFVGASGYQSDPDSSLQLLGHRYYDASTGRFLTRDQAKQGRNWYSYCAGMPTAARDPDGHFLILIAIVVVFILAAETAHTPTSPTDIPPPGWAGGKKLAAVYQLVPMMVEGPAGEGPGDGGYTGWPRDTSLPWEGGPPGGTIRGIKKTRRYGDDGFPDVDRDWDPTHNPPDHAHDVGRPEGGGRPEHEHRGPLRPVRPGDPPPPWGKPGEPPPRLP